MSDIFGFPIKLLSLNNNFIRDLFLGKEHFNSLCYLILCFLVSSIKIIYQGRFYDKIASLLASYLIFFVYCIFLNFVLKKIETNISLKNIVLFISAPASIVFYLHLISFFFLLLFNFEFENYIFYLIYFGVLFLNLFMFKVVIKEKFISFISFYLVFLLFVIFLGGLTSAVPYMSYVF
jgi:hypothetical protein